MTILFILVIMSALALSFLHRTAVGTAATASRAAAMQAQYLAESAVNHALWRLLNEDTFPASPDVYYMHSLAGGRYGYKVRRHTATTFATVATVGACGDQVAQQSYVLYVKSDPLAQGLAGRWKMDETSGVTTYDSSGNGRTGTLTNMDPATDWVAGKSGNALDFDGTNDFVNVPYDASLSLNSKVSAAAWINKDTQTGYDCLIANGSSTSNKDNYWFGTSGDEIYFGYSYSGTWHEATTSNVNLPANTWVHIAFTYDDTSDQVVFYKDGSPVSTQTITGNLNQSTNTGAVTIGKSRFGEYFDGTIDDIRLYNRVLTPAEVLAIYQKGGS